METERLFQQQGAVLLAQSDGCAVWQFHNETGDGTMTAYQVFPGVMLSFNDFHMEYYDCGFAADRRMLAVDHCREGRMEYSIGSNLVGCTASGDMKLDLRQQHTGVFSFPSCHYHGLTVGFDLEVARQALPEEIKDFPATPEGIISRWGLGSVPRVLHSAQAPEHIFSELYHVPEHIRIPYFKVKILELLLCLEAMPVPQDEPTPSYFHRSQVETVKAIRHFLMEHVSENFTQEALSRQFQLPMTAMKTCFRSMYGNSMGAWLTDYRMNLAAGMLRQPGLSIAEIGSRVGYDNPAKFSVAFKRTMKFTPSEYRKEWGLNHEK